VRKEVFEEVGGFEEQNLGVAYNDVDFCLKARRAGYRNIWTPEAILVHCESASRGSDAEGEARQRLNREATWMKQRWGRELEVDPAYNPNLTLASPSGALAFAPRYVPFYRVAGSHQKKSGLERMPLAFLP
jgi:GT2 family glycosyltransferase